MASIGSWPPSPSSFARRDAGARGPEQGLARGGARRFFGILPTRCPISVGQLPSRCAKAGGRIGERRLGAQ